MHALPPLCIYTRLTFERRLKAAVEKGCRLERDLRSLFYDASSAELSVKHSVQRVFINIFQEGVAIIFRVTRDDSWLAKAVANRPLHK